jgi:cation:H+ antiporter
VPLSAAHEYPIWANGLIFLAAGVVVWVVGTRLTRNLDVISQRTGLGQAFVGMLLLGGITSLPELANTITSSVIGNPALSINNLLGSAAINVLLLAIGDAVFGREALTSMVARPSTLMMATLCILVLVAIAMAVTTGDVLVLGVGAWAVAVCMFSIAAFWLAVDYGHRGSWVPKPGSTTSEPEAALQPEKAAGPDGQKSLRRLVAITVVHAALIFVAGYSLSQTGDALAVQTGLGTGMVGFLLIGLSTSMPELSTIFAALRLRRYEMAFGNVLGTNFVNLSFILVADLFFTGGPVINELGGFETISALLGATLIGVFLVGLLERRNAVMLRLGYDSLAVMLLFAAGVALLQLT